MTKCGEKHAHNFRVLSGVLVFLTFAAIAFLEIYPLQDYDLFWHLANGRAMLETGAIVNSEIFSYTSFGKEFVNHAWLSQLLFGFVFENFGPKALIVFKVLLTLFVTLVIYTLCRRQTLRPLLAASVCLLFIAASHFRYVARPHLFSYLCLAFLIYTLFEYRQNRVSKRTLLIVIPVMMVIWDFLHGALFGVIFFGVFLGGETVKYIFASRYLGETTFPPLSRDRFRGVWLCAGITLLCMLVSPYGLPTYDIFYAFVGNNLMTSMTAEFQPTPLTAYPFFWLLLAVSGLTIVMARKDMDLTTLLAWIVFGVLAKRYLRGIGAFSIVAAAAMALHLPVVARDLMVGGGKKRLFDWFLMGGLALGIVWIGVYKFSDHSRYDAFGVGINENTFPVGSVRFVEAVGLIGNIYNTDRYGGYLAYFAYPKRRIFHYNHHILFDALERFVHEPETRAQWNVSYAIVGREDEWKMFDREGFVPVYWEPTAAVLVRNNEQNKEIIKRYRIRYFSPIKSDEEIVALFQQGGKAGRLLQEMAHYLAFRKDGRMADLLGKRLLDDSSLTPGEKEQLYNEVKDRNGESAYLQTIGGIISYQHGDLSAAQNLFSAALKQSEILAARFNLAYALIDGGKAQKGLEQFDVILAGQPNHPASLYGKALAQYTLKQYGLAKETWTQYLQIEPVGQWADEARKFIKEIEGGRRGDE